MIVRIAVLALSLFLISPALHAQSIDDWREIYERMFTDDGDEDVAFDEEEIERLDEIAANPFNVNTVTQEQLREISFLSEKEIDAILYYVYRYGGMITLNELKSIPQLNEYKLKLLRHFLYCGEKELRDNLTLKNLLKYGQHDLYYGGRIPLYERKGDVVTPDDGGYLGYPYKQQFRYTYSYGSRFKIGLVGANDSGEQFFAGRNSAGYDYYSFYAQLKDIRLSKTWKLENLVVGKFRAGFGMGLTMNNFFTLGKTTMMASAGRINTGFRPHSSTSDGKYLQGVGATFQNGSLSTLLLTTSLFASSRKVHATVSGDTISTILSSGYHRTLNEMEKKNAVTRNVLGGDITVSHKHLSAGLTAVYSSLNMLLYPNKTAEYRRYFAQGKDFFTAGVNYAYTSSRLTFKGEVSASPVSQADSVGTGIAFATTNMLNYSPRYGVSFSLLHRYFSQRYTSMFGKSFAESTNLQDEHGVFGGFSWSPTSLWALKYYIDYAYFSRPKYLVSASSNMLENVLNLSLHKGEWTFSMRGRLKNRQYDHKEKADKDDKDKTDKTFIVWKNTASLRLQTDYDADEKNKAMRGLHGKLILQYSYYNKDKDCSRGYMAWINGGFRPWRWLATDFSAGYFNTDDYSSAIYAYERGMNYGMNYQQMYGEGMRFSLMIKGSLGKKLSAAMKLGGTKYFDRRLIGTGMDEITSTIKADIDFQIRWKF